MPSPDNPIVSIAEPTARAADPSADAEAVIASALSGRPLDPEVMKRVTERSKALREDSARRHGVREIAVNLIREIRDEA